MKKFLLPESGNYYKANLHCHTNISDGNRTPEEIKSAYKAHGYSIVAYTDHDVFIPHPELCDESFLALNSMEYRYLRKVRLWSVFRRLRRNPANHYIFPCRLLRDI